MQKSPYNFRYSSIFLLTGLLAACGSGSGPDGASGGGSGVGTGASSGSSGASSASAAGSGSGAGTGASAGSGSTGSAGSGSGSGPDFYAPAPAIEILKHEQAISWSSLGSAAKDLMRFSWSVSGSDDFFSAGDDGQAVEAALGVSPGLGKASTATKDTLLRSMFQFVQIETGVYRIVSSKHPNFAVDVDSSGAPILRDVRSSSRDDAAAGFLGFRVSGTDTVTIQAVGRWVVQSGVVFVEQGGFTAKNLSASGGKLSLSTGTATQFALYSPPLNFDMPFDFNPEQVSRASNAEVTPFSKGADKFETYSSKVLADYAAQVTAPGPDVRTAEAATAALADIEQSLSNEFGQMRYPAEFYLALREGLLSRIYLSAEATDAKLGQYAVPYVYFTNGTDETGMHHPFMVLVTYGLPDTMALLWDVPQPPGDGITPGYLNQDVTRSYHRENFVMKIPLRDYGLVSSIGENIMVASLASDVNDLFPDHHSYASISGLGVAIDGVVIYPTYNNTLHVSAAAGELSAHGLHSGQGLGAHYHADSYSAVGSGFDLYNASDYVGHRHPPIVSVGFDGVAGYGIYQVGDMPLDGADIPLDEFGGHSHGEYGYHYHSYPVPGVSDKLKVSYTAHQLPPLGAWAGRINMIPSFWDGTHPDYSGEGAPRYLGTGTVAQ